MTTTGADIAKIIRKFEEVLDYASGSNVSKFDTDMAQIKMEIDNYQQRFNLAAVKSDLLQILDQGDCELIDIMEYVNKLPD